MTPGHGLVQYRLCCLQRKVPGRRQNLKSEDWLRFLRVKKAYIFCEEEVYLMVKLNMLVGRFIPLLVSFKKV